jgi:hypothetical protein
MSVHCRRIAKAWSSVSRPSRRKCSRKNSAFGFGFPWWSCSQNCSFVGRAVTGWGTCAKGKGQKSGAGRPDTKRRDERTHSLDVTLEGIVGYIDGVRLARFVPFLNLVHRIVVAGGTVHHIYSRIVAVREMVVRCGEV